MGCFKALPSAARFPRFEASQASILPWGKNRSVITLSGCSLVQHNQSEHQFRNVAVLPYLDAHSYAVKNFFNEKKTVAVLPYLDAHSYHSGDWFPPTRSSRSPTLSGCPLVQ